MIILFLFYFSFFFKKNSQPAPDIYMGLDPNRFIFTWKIIMW